VTSSRQYVPHRVVDAGRWPDVAVAAGSPVRAAVARALFTRAVATLPVRVWFPDGRLLGDGPPGAPVMVVYQPREFFRRLGDSGLIGFGESYMAGDLDCADLTGLLTVFAAHAARHHQARVTAVTLSAGQGRYVRQRAQSRGDGVEVRIQDYRDPLGGPYDAIASVEMGEHVGAAQYPRFCATLHRVLKPGGRLLIQQMSRGARAPGGGPFLESYIAPDMHMRPVGETVLLQALILWLASLPVQAGMLERAPAGPVTVLGAVIWLGGFVFESVGDWQLARFKADPRHQGLIMDRGLWRYTRHPNYFGDACMWWGLFGISLGSWAGLATMFAPLMMTYILTMGSGQRLTDRRMAATRPQYAGYAARTSGFIPLPPRRPANTDRGMA
jgi:protein-S-isoprenylcysteine O-methyltransferase Ste14